MLSDLIASHYEQMLDQLGQIHQTTVDSIGATQQSFFQFTEKLTEWHQQNGRQFKQQLEQLEHQHEKELDDHQTVGRKMTIIQEYDRKLKQAEAETEVTKKQLASARKQLAEVKSQLSAVKAQRNPDSTSQASLESASNDEGNQSQEESKKQVEEQESLKEQESSKEQEDDQEPAEVEKPKESPAEAERSEEDREPEKVVAPEKTEVPKKVQKSIPEPEAPKGTKSSLKKIKWKGQIYFYHPDNGQVYGDSTGTKLVGTKDGNKLVLKK